MGRKQYYILNKIIDKCENSKNDWRGETSEKRSFPIQQEDYDQFGRSELLKEARELEKMGLIRVQWFGGHSDISRITFLLDQMEDIYGLAGRIPKTEQLNQNRQLISGFAAEAESDWLKAYYEELICQLEKGKTPQDLKKYGTLLFRCLNALDKLTTPMFVRIFSSHYLSDAKNRGSKVFEEKLEARVVTIARKYHPMVDEAMGKQEVLEQLYLDDYSQELALKGDLKIELNGQVVDLSKLAYGTVLNTETLKNAKICGKQSLKKVITVENKANYVSMPYEEGTLIVFSHGFFSPLERDFLRKLEQVLESQQVHEKMDGTREGTQNVQYVHTGDLDYGGVRIFQHIRKNIFPKLKPYQMDAEQFENYLEFASDIEDSSWEKLRQVQEPQLEPLIGKILETRKVIEQEAFLIKG